MSVLDVDDLPKQLLQHEVDVDEQVELVVEDTGNVLGEEVIEYEEWPGPLHNHEYHPSEQIIVEPYVDEHGIIYEPEYEEYVDEGSPVVETNSITEQHIDSSALHHTDSLRLQDEIIGEDTMPIDYIDFGEHDERGTSVCGPKRMATIVECEICGQIIKHPSKIQAHMRTHTGEKPFECQVCGMRFTQKTPMMNHYRRHIGDTPFACGFGCGKKFVNNAQKNAHELRHVGGKRRGPPRPHLKPPKRRITTVIPVEQYRERRRIEEERNTIVDWQPPLGHIEQPMSAAASKRMDDVIDSVIAGVPLLKRKSPQNRAAIIAQCQICGLMLKHPSKIQAHMRTHTGEKPFECGTCGMRFATPSPLRIHIKRKHSKDRPFPCTWECGMNFVSIGARNEHEKIVHAGIKRYECTAPGCRRMFTRRRYLMMHRAKDHPGIYAPIFDPEEIAQAEMEADVEIMAERGADSALHNYSELTQQVLVDPSTNRIVHITTDGVVVESENEHHFLEGEFIDDNDDSTIDEYVEEDTESRFVSIGSGNEPVSNIMDEQHHIDIHSPSPSDILKAQSSCDSQQSQEPSETLEEVDRKKIWIKGLGDFDPPQMKTVRILKRKVPVRRSD